MKAPDKDRGLAQSGEKSQAQPQAAETVTRPDVTLAVPESWTSVPPSQNFFLSAWELPEGGIANITWLGANTEIITQNLDRWLGQFETASGNSAADATMERVTAGNLPFTWVTLQGTLMSVAQVGGGEPRSDWMLVGAIVESDSGPLYIKVLGPESVLQPQVDAIRAAVMKIELVKGN